jgi:hypothetical protein
MAELKTLVKLATDIPLPKSKAHKQTNRKYLFSELL